jgi:ATP-binding cassette subfamily B (MDR/TAP) protein 1
MFEVIERTPPIDTSDLSGIIPDTLQGEITLENIDFSYPARPDVPIFTNFNLTISPGTTVALVGESGSGKSTVVSLIQRFYDPNGGAVLVDGIDIKTLQLKWLRQQIGLVSQEPVLFSTSIRENIAYGKDGATDKEIQAAAVRANAANFINKMPEGYETQVGEAGIQLSGGQKQRVAIARAILKNPGILLLDEATSALDAESERVVQDALEHIMVGRTTVVVAHRLTTIRNANVIAVLQRGNIVETGTHTELLRNPDGAYSQLVRLQQIEKQQPEEYRRSMGEDNQFPESVDQINSNTSDIITRSVSGRISSGRKSATSTRHSTASLPRVGISSSPDDDKFKSSFKSSGSQQRAHHEDLESSSTTDAQGKKTSLAKKLSLKSLPAETSLFRLVALNKPELPFFILGSLAAAGTGLMFPISGLLISNFISAFFLPNVHQLRHEADKWGLVYGLMAIGIFFIIPIQYSSFGLIGQRLIRRVRRIVFERIVRQEVAWFDKDENGSGSLGARLSTDAASVRAMVGDNLALVVQNLSTIVCGLSIAFSANWELSLLILAMVPLLGMQGFMQVKFSKGFSNDAKVEYQDASRVAGDAVSSIRTVASFCAEDTVVQLYEEKCKMPLNSGIKQGYISGTGLAFSNFVQYACSALAFWVGAILVKENKTTFGDVFKVFFAITMSALAVSRSTSRSTDLTKVKSAVNSIFEIIDTKSKIDPLEKSGQTPKLVRGEVELRHVGFAYPRRPTLPIFKDLNLTVQAGKVSNFKPWACGIFFEHSLTKTTPKLHIWLRFSFTFTLASGQG